MTVWYAGWDETPSSTHPTQDINDWEIKRKQSQLTIRSNCITWLFLPFAHVVF
jgi:hypothetical protein